MSAMNWSRHNRNARLSKQTCLELYRGLNGDWSAEADRSVTAKQVCMTQRDRIGRRVCASPGCETILALHNGGLVCFLHDRR